MPAIRPYYATGSASEIHYDLIAFADPAAHLDVDLYVRLAKPGGTILELGTGTGRVAVPLAERGFAVTGLDIAAGMLAQAEAKRATLGADVAARLQFLRGDMRSLALGRSFDTIIAGYFTLAHVQPSVAWKQAFAGMARHLAPGGTIAVHLPDPEPMKRPAPRPDIPVFQKPIEGGLLTLFVAGQSFNEKVGRFDLLLDYVTSTAQGVEAGRSRERYTLFVGDPEPYAAKAGLRPDGPPEALGASGFIHKFVAA